jgi:hypothetical protein
MKGRSQGQAVYATHDESAHEWKVLTVMMVTRKKNMWKKKDDLNDDDDKEAPPKFNPTASVSLYGKAWASSVSLKVLSFNLVNRLIKRASSEARVGALLGSSVAAPVDGDNLQLKLIVLIIRTTTTMPRMMGRDEDIVIIGCSWFLSFYTLLPADKWALRLKINS